MRFLMSFFRKKKNAQRLTRLRFMFNIIHLYVMITRNSRRMHGLNAANVYLL